VTTIDCTCKGTSGMRFGGEHTTDCAQWLAEFYPDGRTFYDESDDREAFIAACHGLGLWPMTNYPPPEADLEPFTTVQVPAEKLGAFYALGLRVGT
jgi:hypothetical protein